MEIKVFGSSSKGNSYLLKDGDSSILIETGIRPATMRVDWSKIDAVLVTHEDGDHIKYASDVIRRTSADIYCSKGTAQFLKNVPAHRVKHLTAKELVSIGKWNLLPFDVRHDAVEPLGFLIGTPSGNEVLFATDTYYIPYLFDGVTHLMVECNYSYDILHQNFYDGLIDRKRYERVVRSHFALENLIIYLRGAKLKRLKEVHLLHLSDSNSDAEMFKREIMKVTGVPVYIAGGD